MIMMQLQLRGTPVNREITELFYLREFSSEQVDALETLLAQNIGQAHTTKKRLGKKS